MAGYLRPVNPTGICTYYTHTRRTTPSSEAGVDYYCPIGTPVHAAGAGVVFAVAGNILAATGRYVTIDLDDGRRVRYLHLSKQLVRTGQRVNQGDVVALSGASGYGSEFFGARTAATIPANTGGPHVHTTLWAGHYYKFGRFPAQPTLDFEKYVGGSPSSSGGTPFPEATPQTQQGEPEMFAMRSSDPTRGAISISLNGESPLTNEEFDNFYGGPKYDGINARQYDLNLSVWRRHRTTPPAAFVGKGQSPERGWTLFTPGYVKGLSNEELANMPFTVRRVEGNDRQYDLWVSEAVNGRAASFPVAITGAGTATVDQIAQAVNDEDDRRDALRVNVK